MPQSPAGNGAAHCIRINPDITLAVGNAAQDTAMRENRRFHRVRPTGLVAKTGIIFADLKGAPTACTIVDLSAGGACLDVHGGDAIPKRFMLNHGGVRKNCLVMWQKGRRVGVSF